MRERRVDAKRRAQLLLREGGREPVAVAAAHQEEAPRLVAHADGRHHRDDEVEVVPEARRERGEVAAKAHPEETHRRAGRLAQPVDQEADLVHRLAHRFGEVRDVWDREALAREACVGGRARAVVGESEQCDVETPREPLAREEDERVDARPAHREAVQADDGSARRLAPVHPVLEEDPLVRGARGPDARHLARAVAAPQRAPDRLAAGEHSPVVVDLREGPWRRLEREEASGLALQRGIEQRRRGRAELIETLGWRHQERVDGDAHCAENRRVECGSGLREEAARPGLRRELRVGKRGDLRRAAQLVPAFGAEDRRPRALVSPENPIQVENVDVFAGLNQSASTMPPALLALLGALRCLLWPRAALHAEVLALRHQLLVLNRRRAGMRVGFRTWSLLSRFWPGWRQALVLVRPETVIRWHQRGFRLYWRWKSRSRRPGRPTIEAEVRDLILKMHRANPSWRRLGSTASSSSLVSRLRSQRSPSTCRGTGNRHPRAGGTFLQNHLREALAIDFAVVPTGTFRLLYVFVVLKLGTTQASPRPRHPPSDSRMDRATDGRGATRGDPFHVPDP